MVIRPRIGSRQPAGLVGSIGRRLLQGLGAIVLLTVSVPVLLGERPVAPTPLEGPAPHDARTAPQRWREGTHLEHQEGSFTRSTDRFVFVLADGRGQFVVLENLNLERIARLSAESQTNQVWAVSGTISEFRGTNYLFVTWANRQRPQSTGPSRW
jgi:hypothetical protein